MRSSRKFTVAAATAVSLLAFSALGFSLPRDEAPAKDSGRSCCGPAVDACCSGPSARPVARVALATLGGQDAERPAAKKAERKAGPDAIAKGVATRKALLEQVSALAKDGVAHCCVEPGCGFCVIAADGCGCAKSLAKGGPVCPECWGGWQAGQGMVPDVDADKVKILPKDVLEKVYGMKAEKLEQAGAK